MASQQRADNRLRQILTSDSREVKGVFAHEKRSSPEGWGIFLAVLPSAGAEEGGLALHLSLVALTSPSCSAASLPTLG